MLVAFLLINIVKVTAKLPHYNNLIIIFNIYIKNIYTNIIIYNNSINAVGLLELSLFLVRVERFDNFFLMCLALFVPKKNAIP